MPTVQISMLGRFEVAVDGVPVPEGHWARRHAAALVKVLAMAPGRRLHREQLLDLIWPDDPLDEAVPKLHKAAHFARRAIAVPSSIVLRGDSVVLAPEADVGAGGILAAELFDGVHAGPSGSQQSRSTPLGADRFLRYQHLKGRQPRPDTTRIFLVAVILLAVKTLAYDLPR